MGRTDTATLDENIQTACKVTGLSEYTIKHLQEIQQEQYEDFIYEKTFDVMNALIYCIDISMLLDIKELLISELKEGIFKIETIKQYCKKNNIPFSEKEIEEKGEFIFKVNQKDGFWECKKWHNEYKKKLVQYNIIDYDLKYNKDYRVSKLSNDFITLIRDEVDMYLDNTIFTDDFYKKIQEYYKQALQFEPDSEEFFQFINETD